MKTRMVMLLALVMGACAPMMGAEPAPRDVETTSPDMLQGLPDATPTTSPDLQPACGKVRQGCCGFSCASGLLCLVDGETCGGQVAHQCVQILSLACGVLNAPPCDDDGFPSDTGRCRDGLRVWANQAGVKCIMCGA